MNQGISIRLAEPNDALAIIDFNQRMAQETENKELPLEIITNGVTAVFADSNKGFYVVGETSVQEIVGCLMITFEWSDWRAGWFWWIQSVYVRSDFRGQGVYKKLYEWVTAQATAKGNVCGIRLYVEKDNMVAQKVYEKLDMEETHYLMYEAIFE
ncbi:MAG: GNAT family N-acetyltransferase [Pyrinomonadaceae bacterium]